MTQEIIEMARDSGMELYGLGKDRARFVHHLEAFAKLVAEKALAEHAMREVQRFGQEIEQEPICPKCKAKVLYECIACSSNNYPPPQRTEPPQKKVWTFWDLSGGDITDAIKAKLKEKNT